MADEGDARAGGRVDFGLERQHHGEPIGALDDASHAAAPPGPDLRRDVVEHGDAGALGGAGERQVELGEVDKDDQVGALATQRRFELAQYAEGFPYGGSQFGEAEAGDVLGAGERAHARCAHPLAGDAEQIASGVARENLRGEVGAVKIARGLAGDDHHAPAARRRRGGR